MSKCKWCGKGGSIFGPKLTENGLCKYCDAVISHEVIQSGRILIDSLKIVQKTKNINTKISRIDLIIENARSLLKYEEKDINTVEPKPSLILQDFYTNRDDYILEGIKEDLNLLNKKLKLDPTIVQINREFTKISKKLEEIRTYLKDEEKIKQFEIDIRKSYRELVIETHLENGKKAEFKGQHKKAKDHYFDALYFIENEDISTKTKNEIKGKIQKFIDKIEID